jgi:hypothetical protein
MCHIDFSIALQARRGPGPAMHERISSNLKYSSFVAPPARGYRCPIGPTLEPAAAVGRPHLQVE